MFLTEIKSAGMISSMDTPVEIRFACKVDPVTGLRDTPILKLTETDGTYRVDATSKRSAYFRGFAAAVRSFESKREQLGLTVIRTAAGPVAA